MTDARERVVLGADPDVQGAVAGARHERGRQIADAHLHLEAGPGQGLGDPGRRPGFLERQLGMGVNPVREGEQLTPAAIHDLPWLRPCHAAAPTRPPVDLHPLDAPSRMLRGQTRRVTICAWAGAGRRGQQVGLTWAFPV